MTLRLRALLVLPLGLAALLAQGVPDLVEAMQRTRDPDERLAACERILAHPSATVRDRATAHSWRADLHAQLGDLALAAADYEETLRLDPESAGARLELGRVLALLGRAEEAEQVFDEALRRDPRARGAWIGRGYARGLREDWDGARADLDVVLAARPDDLDARFLRAWVRASGDDLLGSLEDLAAVSAVRPDHAEASALREELLAPYDADGREAIDLVLAARRGAALEPWLRAAEHCERTGLVRLCAETLDQALERHPDEPGLGRWRGVVAYQLGEYGRAGAELRRAAEARPTDVFAGLLWFRALQRLGCEAAAELALTTQLEAAGEDAAPWDAALARHLLGGEAPDPEAFDGAAACELELAYFRLEPRCEPGVAPLPASWRASPTGPADDEDPVERALELEIRSRLRAADPTAAAGGDGAPAALEAEAWRVADLVRASPGARVASAARALLDGLAAPGAPTLQERIDAVPDGGVVELPGERLETDDGVVVAERRGLSLRGRPGTRILCRADTFVLYVADCTDLRLEALSAAHAVPPAGVCSAGVLVAERVQGLEVVDCELDGCGVQGLEATDCREVVVRGNRIHHNSLRGLGLYRVEDLVLEDNRLWENGEPGTLRGVSGAVTIRGNTSDDEPWVPEPEGP